MAKWLSVVVVCVWGASAIGGCGNVVRLLGSDAEGGASHTNATDGDAGAQGGVADSPEAQELSEIWLGRSCHSDDDCGGSLSCLRNDQDFHGQGAPAGGLCTASCLVDADCSAFDASAVCATLAEAPLVREFASSPVPRICLQGCSLGSPGGSSKCHGRSDQACRPFAPEGVEQCRENGSCPNGGLCFRDRCRELACGPRCNAKTDCGEGRSCDPESGLCVAYRSASVPIGAACNPDAPRIGACGSGTCLVLFDNDGVRGKSMCTQSCTLGQRCGEGSGACVMPRFSDYAVGDVAYCSELCTCNDDCSNPADACVRWDKTEQAAHFGSEGLCQEGLRDEKTLDCGAAP